MKTTLGTYLAAAALMVGTLVAQQTPTTITPASPQPGIAPNGIGATTSTLLFSQPYCDSSSISGSQMRGIYSATNLMNLTPPPATESATITDVIPLPSESYCGGDEMYFVISPGVGGFPQGSVYTAVVTSFGFPSTAGIYKDGAPTPISGISDPDQGHAGITFDTAGKFGNALILTTSTGIYGFNSAGTQTFHYPSPTSPAFFYLEGASVAPLSNSACPGCLYVTATDPSGAPGAILVVDPTKNPPTNSGMAPIVLATFPGLEPENIQFVSPTTCTLSGTDLSYFVSGYSTTYGSIPSTTGALFGFSPSQIATVQGMALIPEETGGTIYAFDPQLLTFTPFSTPITPSGQVYQLEGSALLGEASGACPKCNSSLVPVTYNVHENNSANEIAWFNSHLTKLQGTIPTSTFQIFITGGKITFGPTAIPVPDSVITFSSTAGCSSTSFNTVLNRWEITIPLSAAGQADEIFAAGAAYLIPSGFPQNVNNVTWSANISSSAPGLDVTWQYGVSNWLTSNKGSVFPTLSTSPFQADYNAMQVDPAHNAPLCSGNSGDHAGAPEFAGRNNVLTGGGSGGGGSNWTGSWSSTPGNVQVCHAE